MASWLQQQGGFTSDKNHVAALIRGDGKSILVQLDPIHFGDFFVFFSGHLRISESRRSSVGVAGGLPC